MLDVTVGGLIHKYIICLGVGNSLLEIHNFTTISLCGIFSIRGLAIKRKQYLRKLYICNVISFGGVNIMKIDVNVFFLTINYIILGYRFQTKVIKHR